jgi:hypothetical protein
MTTPPSPPWGELIRARREGQPGLSIRQAARQARISVTTWTDIEKGWRFAAPGTPVGVHGAADKLASMALITGVSPEELEGTGRRDAAVILAHLLDAQPADVSRAEAEQLAHSIASRRGLTERQRRELVRKIIEAVEDTGP